MICVPGGNGTRPGMTHEPLLSYIRRTGAEAQLVTSVCTGAFLLHATGFLEGKRATTYWGAKKEFRELGGNVEVVDDERWVHDGNVITAAGVSAGIDMALYVVGQLKSPEDARKVQAFMEYQPAPPLCGGDQRAGLAAEELYQPGIAVFGGLLRSSCFSFFRPFSNLRPPEMRGFRRHELLNFVSRIDRPAASTRAALREQ